jgi:hypothetical protein
MFQLHTHSHWHTFTPFLVILITLTCRFQPTVIVYKTAFDLCARDPFKVRRGSFIHHSRSTAITTCHELCFFLVCIQYSQGGNLLLKTRPN